MKVDIEKLSLDWFLVEPALFKVLCLHNVVENVAMDCAVRCGQRRIEYNPQLCSELTEAGFAEAVKAECIRILLKHPYERRPQGCSPEAITLGSDCVLADNYDFKHLDLQSPKEWSLEAGQHYEYYAKAINQMQPAVLTAQGLSVEGDGQGEGQGKGQGEGQGKGHGEGQGNGQGEGQGNGQEQKKGQGQGEGMGQGQGGNAAQADASALWQEDPMVAAEVNELIKVLEASQGWGSLPGQLVGMVIASTKVRIDFRKVMQSFRADILSSKRRLTRMRPNRRSGFENFGSVYRLTSRLLVAIDVSGSTTDAMVADFCGIVNKFFKYGIEEIDVVQFDVGIKGEPEKLKKAKKSIDIVGRGGTAFQPVIDFVHERKNYYHGLIIFTDGYASKPVLPPFFNTPILWVLPSEVEYENNKCWMREIGRACFIKT